MGAITLMAMVGMTVLTPTFNSGGSRVPGAAWAPYRSEQRSCPPKVRER